MKEYGYQCLGNPDEEEGSTLAEVYLQTHWKFRELSVRTRMLKSVTSEVERTADKLQSVT